MYARKVAQRHGIELHEIEIGQTSSTCCRRMVDMLDEPIGDPAAINTLLMSGAARDRGVKVLLPGWARTSCSAVTANTWRASWPAGIVGFRTCVHRSATVSSIDCRSTAGGRGPALRPLGQALRDVRRAA